jgi:hypothetical protein
VENQEGTNGTVKCKKTKTRNKNKIQKKATTTGLQHNYTLIKYRKYYCTSRTVKYLIVVATSEKP